MDARNDFKAAEIEGFNALVNAGGPDEGLDTLERLVIKAMDSVPPHLEERYGRAVRVWLADLLVEAAEVLRDQEAADAEVAGVPMQVISGALGYGNSSNARRKARHWKAFADARRAADIAGVDVPVDAGRIRRVVTPRPTR